MTALKYFRALDTKSIAMSSQSRAVERSSTLRARNDVGRFTRRSARWLVWKLSQDINFNWNINSQVYETVVDWEYEQKCTTSYEEECHGYGYHQECEKVKPPSRYTGWFFSPLPPSVQYRNEKSAKELNGAAVFLFGTEQGESHCKMSNESRAWISRWKMNLHFCFLRCQRSIASKSQRRLRSR